MDIKRFVHQRKKLGYSQVTLSKGICTQSTLSKFENNGQVPSLVILEKLCERLGLTIDDLNQNDTSSIRYTRDLLDEIERLLMIEQFPDAIRKLKRIQLSELRSPRDKMQYFYLKGMIYTLTNNQVSKTLFNFTKILDELDEQHRTIYSQLAYLGSGILYARKNSMDHADFFFAKVIGFLQEHADDDFSENDFSHYLRILTLMYYVAEYHALEHRIKISNQVLAAAVQICARNHVTYYLPRIKLLAANNALTEGKSSKEIMTLLDEADVFARFNDNNVVQVQVAAFKKLLLTKTNL